VLGPGAGFLYHFDPHFAWIVEGRVLAGVPDFAVLGELSTGGQATF
jgi:carbon starvation protein CstA